MPGRTLPLVALVLVAALAAVGPAAPDQIHRNGFAGREPFWAKGDSNIKWDEKAHKISDERYKNAPTSEYFKIEANPPAGSVEAEYVHYYYDLPPAPITDRLAAQLWVKSYRPGVQLKARIVLPKERDPANPDAAFSTVVIGDTYRNLRQWQPLSMGNVPELLRKHLPVLHARLGRAVDPTDAYIDRLVLNVFAGPGITEVWVDDLEVGPVRTDLAARPKRINATVTGQNGIGRLDVPAPKARTVEFTDGQIEIDRQPFFMLAIRHSDTPLKILHDAGLNTVWFPQDVTPETMEEAARNDFWIVPSVPLSAGAWDGNQSKAITPDTQTISKDADAVARYIRQFLSGDAVLMWDLGTGRTTEEVDRVRRTAEAIRTYDPRRPRAVDLWDGYDQYSAYADCIGTHRWPLFTSLELSKYKEWLTQRKLLTPPGKMSWTWIQTHLPDWYVELLTGRPDTPRFDDPIGPHPEQIRILTYLALAAGNRGLGYWSDRFLANSHHGRDRFLEIAMLNTEIELLKPILADAPDPAQWMSTSNPYVEAAVIHTNNPNGLNEMVVLPIWLGPGTQYCPAQGTVSQLKFRVPKVPDNASAWLISAAGVTELKTIVKTSGGAEITIPEFDMTAAVVLTSDLKLNGKIVKWQDHTRYRGGEKAAEWALLQATEQYNKTLHTHQRILAAGGPPVTEAENLFARSKEKMDQAREYLDNRQWDTAFREARRALRPLRILMREDWRLATESLDVPTASPYAVSFYSLPQHWMLAKEVAASRPAGTALPYGQFELSRPAPGEGAAITSLPGWRVRKSLLDPVTATAGIINSKGYEDKRPEQPYKKPTRYGPDRVAYQPDDFDLMQHPDLGTHCLFMHIKAKVEKDKSGKDYPPPVALERTFMAVDTAPVDLPPGQLVRISFWARALGINASADGVVAYDSAGGEPLGVRIASTTKKSMWQQFHLYRRVPANGKIAVTFALTGIGPVLFDDVRIEPLVAGLEPPPEQTGLRSAAPVARGQR